MRKKIETEKGVSRRGFLSSAAVAGIASGAGMEIAGSALPAIAKGPATPTMQVDVVVCGSGIGGLSSALRAQKAGSKVIVLEKAYEPGGTTLHSEGGVGSNRNYQQLHEGCPEGDPVVQRTVCENVDKWGALMDSIGAPVGGVGPLPGALATAGPGRSIAPVMWVNFMVKTIEAGGGKILVETPMVSVLTNRANEVVGVLADGPNGLIRIQAKAVVLATGGWMTNFDMVQSHITRYAGMLRQRNASFYDRKPPFLGDGFFAAMALGGQPSTGGFDGFYGHMLPARPAKIVNPMSDWSCYFSPYCVAVNRMGRRFTDEGQGREVGRKFGGGDQNCDQEVARQPDAMAALVYDDIVYKQYACQNCGLGGIDKYIAYKMAGAPTAMANTIEELAQQMQAWEVGIVADNVIHDVNEYNQAARNGKTWMLPIPKTNVAQALVQEHPPYYAILGQAGITSTHGGIRVNELGQVLHRSMKPIPGLFAAGVDVGNFNNFTYNGNLCIGAAYGYVSGGNAGKQPAPKGGWEPAAWS